MTIPVAWSTKLRTLCWELPAPGVAGGRGRKRNARRERRRRARRRKGRRRRDAASKVWFFKNLVPSYAFLLSFLFLAFVSQGTKLTLTSQLWPMPNQLFAWIGENWIDEIDKLFGSNEWMNKVVVDLNLKRVILRIIRIWRLFCPDL